MLRAVPGLVLAAALTLLGPLFVVTPADAQTFDFSWQSSEFVFLVPNEPAAGPFVLTGQSTATLQTTGPLLAFRFDGPGTGPFDGLWGGDLNLNSGTVINGGIEYPTAILGSRLNLGVLTFTSSGFTIAAQRAASGPDPGSSFFGTGLLSGAGGGGTVAAVEPGSLLALAAAGLAGAGWLRRQRRSAGSA